MLKGVNLYLIGMMGVGKTTIGRLLADQLDYQFFDVDAVIEQASGQSISQIFAESGEAAFRQLETNVLAELAPYTRLAIATGGGIVLKPENWGYLRHGVIVWLDLPLDELHNRLQHDRSRPLLQSSETLKARLNTLTAQRQSLYAQADVKITAQANESPTEVSRRVMEAIAQACQQKIAATQEIDRLNREAPYKIQNQIQNN
ncbi:shikimate kinase [Phormidesmis sp. 146-35]